MLFRRNQILSGCAPLLLIAWLAHTPTQAQTTSNVIVRMMAANLTGNSQTYDAPQIRIFQGLKPDVVAVQEFNYAGNTPTEFRTFVDATFGTNFSYFRENSGYQIPNGIISRYPILASGSWVDTVQGSPNRGFAWAQIDLPGTNKLYVVSVHFLTTSSANRANEAANLKTLIQSNFPTNGWIIVAGDFNTTSRTETAMDTLTTFLSDNPIPTDAESGGNPDTNEPRNNPYDYVLPSFAMTNRLTNVVFSSHSFSKGLVFDSRIYTPLTDVPPVLSTDSASCQHMGVLKDFLVTVSDNSTNTAPNITLQPQSQTVPQGNDASFTVTANGTAPLSYQWRFGGTNIAIAATSSFTRVNVQTNDAGDYTVVITNNFGNVTSSIATLTVSAAPFVTNQPQSLTVTVGQGATFTVGAGGAAPLSYQWRFFGTNLPGATNNAFTRAAAQTADAGNYTVVVTNSAGSVTSSVATLTVSVAGGTSIIARWNFNSLPADGNTTTGTTTPSLGAGTASLVGGATATFASGDTSLDPAGATDNSAWNSATLPAQGTGNKTRGVQFNVSTAGKQSIQVTWSERLSATASKYTRLQYSSNGTDFVDFPTAVSLSADSVFEAKTNNLAGISAVNNNSSFAFRLLSEFESTANNTANANYVTAGTGTYGTGGTMRYDMVTVWGADLAGNNPPAQAPVLSAPLLTNGQFQFLLTGSAGSNYVIQASTNLSTSNWVSLRTNFSPFTFTETNAASFWQRFYRALAPP